MKRLLLMGLLLSITSFLFAQKVDNSINVKEVTRIENVLASDAMRGRQTYSPELDKAADFIASEFKAAGLKTWNNAKTYKQDFALASAKQLSITAMLDGQPGNEKNITLVTFQPDVKITDASGYEKVTIKAGDNFSLKVRDISKADKNQLILVDTSFARNFQRLNNLKRNAFKSDQNLVFILGTAMPTTFSIEAKHEITEKKLTNVVGILPGRSKKNEYVIFSGHYDHIGVEKHPAPGEDSIYNGANDDAAGTTAVILLANYFKALNNNERTLVFATFTAEEIGGFGSQYFSRQFDADKVMAMFNIEMIGTESKWGRNSAYITGFEKTDMGAILQKNLQGTDFTFYPDPYPEQQLFYRSDNATLARLGVPAHTISTSKMDSEPNYHKVSDEIKTLDMANMAMIIKSVALSSRGIVAGKETPTRVNTEGLTR